MSNTIKKFFTNLWWRIKGYRAFNVSGYRTTNTFIKFTDALDRYDKMESNYRKIFGFKLNKIYLIRSLGINLKSAKRIK